MKLQEELKLREEHLFEMEESNTRNQQKILEELQNIMEKRQEMESLLQTEKQELKNLEIEFSEIQMVFLEKDERFEKYEKEIEQIEFELERVNKETEEIKQKQIGRQETRKKYEDLCQEQRKDFDFNRGLLKNKFLAEKKTLTQKSRLMAEKIKMEANALQKCEKENHSLDQSIRDVKSKMQNLRMKMDQFRSEIELLYSRQSQIQETEKLNQVKILKAESLVKE